MAIILLPICFICIFFSLGITPGASPGKKELLLFTALIFSFGIALITEILSLFHQLTYTAILITWSSIATANILFLYRRRNVLRRFCIALKNESSQYFNNLSRFQLVLFVSTLIILSLIFLQGIIYPPTNWDSMTYHLARTVSWISHRSVEYFPTTITRQLYQPPFAEFVLLHVNVLTRGDEFAAAVQFCFLLFSLTTIAGLVELLGLSRKYQFAAILLGATIPEVVLQASSTQNDIVVSFFILAAFYCAIKVVRTVQFKYYLFFGVAAGLALLTKGTAYIFLSPVFLVFGIAVIIRAFKTRKPLHLIYGLMACLIAIVINSGYYYRNYNLDQNILGVDKTEVQLYANQQMSPSLLASGIIKNTGLHFGLMYAKPISLIADSAIHKLHAAAGVNINDPAVNFRGMKYGIGADTGSEDSAPNLFHFLLVLAAFVLVFIHWKKWKDKPLIYSLIAIIILQAILFCFYLKWQPWNSRLHVPVFLMVVPLICYAFSLAGKFRKLAYVLLPLLLIYAFLTAWHNKWRPISSKIYKEGRYEKYFASKQNAYPEYDLISKAIGQNHFKNIGLMIGPDDWEYPLFTRCYDTELNPIHIKVNNFTAETDLSVHNVDCIISTTTNQLFIEYNNKRYYKQDSKNKIIHLYK